MPRHEFNIDPMTEPLATCDSFYHGKVLIKQPKKGYRFAVDSPILADFLPVSAAPALEIGCGVGVVSLLALHLKKFPAITGVEIQEILVRLAVDNAAANGMSKKFRVIHGDFKRMYAGLSGVQTIFCNPPFFKATQGRLSPDLSIRLARFETSLTMTCLLRGSAVCLAPSGQLFLIYPFSRLEELLSEAKDCGLFPIRIRLVQPFVEAPPDRFLAQLGKSAVRCRHEKPLIIFREKGIYTAEMKKILSGV